MRPPGGWTVDMFNFANDFDFYREWANVVVNGRFDATSRGPTACLYVSRRDGRQYAMSHEDVLREFGDLIVQRGAHGPRLRRRHGRLRLRHAPPRSRRRCIDAAQRIQRKLTASDAVRREERIVVQRQPGPRHGADRLRPRRPAAGLLPVAERPRA